jgi:hypothetical protein
MLNVSAIAPHHPCRMGCRRTVMVGHYACHAAEVGVVVARLARRYRQQPQVVVCGHNRRAPSQHTCLYTGQHHLEGLCCPHDL